MKLDYSLTTDEERLNYILSLPLSTYSPSTLEYITNYILYGKQPSQNTKDHKTQELKETQTQTQIKAQYTNTKLKTKWNLPALQTITESKNIIQTILNSSTDPQQIAKLKRWKKELSQDATEIQLSNQKPITITPSLIPHTPLNIYEFIDYTNSFHIKQLIIHYSALRQSEHSKYDIFYLDQIIDKTPLENWQFHLLARRIDGANQITIGVELAQNFDKIISPTYMSTAMRTIYQKIAKTAKQKQLEFEDMGIPEKWKKCPTCQKILYNNNYYWHTKKKSCKACEKERRQKHETTKTAFNNLLL